MNKSKFILCLLLVAFKLQAQNTAGSKLGAWYMFNGSHKLSEKFALQTMAHFRYFELASEFQQEIYRLGANYTFSKKTNLTIGLSYATADVVYDAPSNNLYEWRLYEDFNINSKWKKFKARHRLRLEHRFIHRNITDETRNWFRYDLNVNYPIAKNWSIYAFNEIFLNIDRAKTFAQNWTGAGILRKVNDNLKLKFGYFQIKTPNTVFKRLRFGILLNTDFF